MQNIIYIKHNCNSCQQIVQLINERHIPCIIINADHSRSDLNVAIVPALYRNGQLIAYGNDILSHLYNQ